MRQRRRLSDVLIGAVLITASAQLASAGGWLWIAAEFTTPYSIYRYNLDTATIDMALEPQCGGISLAPATDVYNNLVFDGTTAYIGEDDGPLFAPFDPWTGIIDCPLVGSIAPIQNSQEDGAWNGSTLWRAQSSGGLYESDQAGNVLNTWSCGATVGLEWVAGTLYATDFFQFGSITLSPGTCTFNPIPITGIPAGDLYWGLALDLDTDTLYMASTGDTTVSLYTIDITAGTATFVDDLLAKGYPAPVSRVNPDGMGWISPGIVLAVNFDSVTAVRVPGGVRVRWVTSYEDDVRAFSVHRAPGPGEMALEVTSPHTRLRSHGAFTAYEFLDATAGGTGADGRYYVQEHTGNGPGTRSPIVEVIDLNDGGGRSRDLPKRP